MAEASLRKIVEEIKGGLSKTYRETLLNKEKHVVPINTEDLKAQLWAEISAKDKNLADNPSFTPQLLTEATKVMEKGIRVLLGSYIKGNLIVVPPSGNSYRIISSNLTRASQAAIDYIEESIGSSTNLDARSLIQFDHTRAVSDTRIANAFTSARGGQALLAQLGASNYLIEEDLNLLIEIISYYTSDGKRVFRAKAVVEGQLESGEVNVQRGRTEVLTRRFRVQKALESALASRDWANQKGSDSKIENIEKTLVNAAIKAGAKGKLQKLDKRTSKVTDKSKIVSKEKVSTVRIPLNTKPVSPSHFNLMSLIGVINSKLPPIIRENMVGGAIHNRTGRFSESAKIVSIGTTERGFPLLNYTYQRSPYDVFDPVLGASPWNKPGRDPKKLLEVSIRQLAQDMAIGRFYVRRA